MDLDRPHFRTTSIGSSSTTAVAPTTAELFICFTSRLSSSSMKLTKSILSPGRAARDGGAPVTLSSSLSRRLRTNGSLKGGASPFFTTTGKKRGCGFENPEPSSPKVTCIGQVRVKTKKKVKQTRSLSKRRSGEVSFRKIEHGSGSVDGCEDKSAAFSQQQRYSNASAHYQQQPQQEGLPHRNQRWVHLPISICEALRAFGAEFSCLFPCKSSCFSNNEREKGEKQDGNESGCGAVFARWLVSVNDGEGGKRREIELVVGGGDEEVEEERAEARVSMRSSRRHVFDDIEVKDDRIEVKGQSVEGGDQEAARVSICVPPKNALLLMRCRSDPMKMADLAHRFSWDANAAARNESEVIEEEINSDAIEDFEEQIRRCEGKYEQDVAVSDHADKEEQGMVDEAEAEAKPEMREEELIISSEDIVEETELEKEIEVNEEVLVVEEEGKGEKEEEEEEEVESNMSSFEALLEQENAEQYEDCTSQDKEQVEDTTPICHLSSSSQSDEDEEDVIEHNVALSLPGEAPPLPGEEATPPKEKEESNATVVNNYEENQAMKTEPETTDREDEEEEEKSEIENPNNQEFVISDQKPKKEKENPVLPDCLLLMMCEPKLSMEVSKETWVCSTDFIRWLPERPRKAAQATKGGGCHHEPVKRRLSIDSKPKPIAEAPAAQNCVQPKQHLQQPPRSSCTLPAAAASMATMIEQKLVNAVGYEPFVLTRCKSEPMRTAAAKLMPESCFWNKAVRKMEPHRRATLGVGAAGVGF
ncbi:hypothetical protein BUALT_Bualt03G0141500 [Buddleja alternifolia]|uniref:Uncharacterized protein n=1 Tax=Buddleja alternifolia TaxID=168488 RepID=A0AAV6Y0B1_9LAMI|nr:hypothetical protein BUALT_Bualt03G0141500 [Buddleja alternifolia]